MSAGVLESALQEQLGAALTPLCAAVEALKGELEAVRRALPPQFGSPQQAAEALGVSLPTVRRKIRAGEIPSRRIGRRVVVDLGGLRPKSDDEIATLARAARWTP